MRRRPTYQIILVLLVLVPFAGQAQEEVFVLDQAPFSSRAYDEYSPAIFRESVVFTANKRITYTTQRTDASGKTVLNLFSVQPAGEDGWTEPQLFSNDISSAMSHHGWATYNGEGTLVYFNRNYERTGIADARVGIFFASFVDGVWTDIQPFQHNDPEYNFFHPSLSRDGKRLFFSSNRPGGSGGYDLYVCTRIRESWSEPKNLGTAVNTKRHEIYPVYHENGRLYFSSNEHPGLGGYDIFFSEEIEDQWILPVHLPAPFNTRRNEACFITLDTTYQTGYITSNRDRTRTNSIYQFRLDIPETLFIECKLQKQNNYCFTFYESGTMEIDTTNFMYEWLIEGKRFPTEEVDYCFNGPGNYIIQLNVIDMLSGAVMFNEATYNLDIENIEQVYITSPDTILVNEAITLDGNETNVNEFEIGRYVWNMGDLFYQADSVISHTYYKPGNYIIRLGVTNLPGTPEEIQHSCSSKRVVVLPRREDDLSVQ